VEVVASDGEGKGWRLVAAGGFGDEGDGFRPK